MRSRKAVIRELDKVFGDYIKTRDKQCVTCPSKGPLDPSHLVRKARGNFLRWHPDNVHAQCRPCHMRHHNTSEAPLVMYAIDKLGKARVQAMQVEAHMVTHWKTYQLEEMIRYWRGKA